MKILTIIGARPQFVKAAVVSRAIQKSNDNNSHNIEEIIVNTGQHYDKNMSEVFFSELNIPLPNYNLGIGSANHGAQTGEMLKKIEEIILTEKPDLTLVYGDTNSTLAGALASSKQLIPVVHIEAGLRSFNFSMPEEQNRILTDHISSFLFCPTKTAVDNLANEGIKDNLRRKRVINCGDVMYDAVIYNKELAHKKSNILDNLGCIKNQYVLATIHRAENTDNFENLSSIFKAFESYKETIVLPLHPRTRKYLDQYKLRIPKNVNIIDPIGYLDMLLLEANASIIATDSGGVQKEAFFLEVPCITLRNETEWIETVNCGWNQLVGTTFDKIINALNNKKQVIIDKGQQYVFGDGFAGEKIVRMLQNV